MTTNTNRNETATRKIFENARITGFKPLVDVPLMYVYFETATGTKLHAIASAHCSNVRQFMTPKGSIESVTCTITVCTKTVEVDGKSHWVLLSPLKQSEEGRIAYEKWAEAQRRNRAPLSADEELTLRYILASVPTRKPQKPQEPTSDLEAAVELL